ncbi:MAG: hypothetical protein J1E96_06080 [Ruminococcus sp.]|nr:hypothetical protein [Ruminococcus sp.]
MYDMKELKIKLYYLGDFLFTVRVNGEEKEVDSKTNTIAFRLPEDADYEIEIAQKELSGNFKLWHILLAPLLLVLFVIFLIIFEEIPGTEWVGDIHPFLLRTKFRGNMRKHNELNFYYYASRNIKDDYTKPQLVCDEIKPYETIYEVNRKNIKKTFHRFVAVMSASMLVLMAIFVLMLMSGLIGSPIDILEVIVSSVLIAVTIAGYAIVLLIKRRRWYKYMKQ